MRKTFSIFDGLFLLFLYFKLSGTGPGLAWWEVWIPYMIEVVYIIGANIAKAFAVRDRLKYFLWNIAVKVRVKQAGKQARRVMATGDSLNKQRSNPGKFIDPDDLPRQNDHNAKKREG